MTGRGNRITPELECAGTQLPTATVHMESYSTMRAHTGTLGVYVRRFGLCPVCDRRIILLAGKLRRHNRRLVNAES